MIYIYIYIIRYRPVGVPIQHAYKRPPSFLTRLFPALLFVINIISFYNPLDFSSTYRALRAFMGASAPPPPTSPRWRDPLYTI